MLNSLRLLRDGRAARDYAGSRFRECIICRVRARRWVDASHRARRHRRPALAAAAAALVLNGIYTIPPEEIGIVRALRPQAAAVRRARTPLQAAVAY